MKAGRAASSSTVEKSFMKRQLAKKLCLFTKKFWGIFKKEFW
jgi:hypothetical protein